MLLVIDNLLEIIASEKIFLLLNKRREKWLTGNQIIDSDLIVTINLQQGLE